MKLADDPLWKHLPMPVSIVKTSSESKVHFSNSIVGSCSSTRVDLSAILIASFVGVNGVPGFVQGLFDTLLT